MNWQYAAPEKAEQEHKVKKNIYFNLKLFLEKCVFTCTQLLDLCVGELQRVVHPRQHVMATQVLYGHRGGVDIHRHPPARHPQTHKHM